MALHTQLRDERTGTAEFVRATDPLLRQLVELAVGTLETKTVVRSERQTATIAAASHDE